ncbi:MAG: hypothetical protein QXU97_01690 [Fervidicoccaceae archaeon]
MELASLLQLGNEQRGLLPPAFQSIFMLLMLASVLTLMYYSMMKRAEVPKGLAARKTIVVIGCSNCDYNESRDFSRGDYIGKDLGPCPKCSNGRAYVKLMYSEPVEEKDRRKGIKGPQRAQTSGARPGPATAAVTYSLAIPAPKLGEALPER